MGTETCPRCHGSMLPGGSYRSETDLGCLCCGYVEEYITFSAKEREILDKKRSEKPNHNEDSAAT